MAVNFCAPMEPNAEKNKIIALGKVIKETVGSAATGESFPLILCLKV